MPQSRSTWEPSVDNLIIAGDPTVSGRVWDDYLNGGGSYYPC
jgi:hypothetical protein